jgi:FMN phosphatase YigB (HAD superfamily)
MKLEKTKKVVFLDWNGTLSKSFFWEQMRVSNNKKVKESYWKWDKALFSKPKEYIQDWMRGGKTTELVLKEIADETKTQYEKILREFIVGCKSMTFVSNDLSQIILDLRKRGLCVVIATNNMDCFTRWTVPNMGLEDMFDEILNSFYLKGLKHDVNQNGESVFFNDFFAKYKFSPSECIFFDDSIDKDNYISGLGIRYIQIESSKHLLYLLEAMLR